MFGYIAINQVFIYMKKITIFVTFFVIIGCKKDGLAQGIDSLSIFSSKISIDTTTVASYKSELLKTFYAEKGNKTIWNDSIKRDHAMQILKKSSAKGLNPEDYFYGLLQIKEKYIKNLTEKELIDFDVMLSHGLQKYIGDVSNGKLNPKFVYKDWDLKEKIIDVNNILSVAYGNDSFEKDFQNIEPKSEGYAQLQTALNIIDALPDDYFLPLYSSKKIKPNETNAKIVAIKKRLMYWRDLAQKDTISKIYDKEAVKAMKQFQTRHGLQADGIIGMGTIRALNFYKNERREQIVANLERWRWFPDDFGSHYTLVNIPDYSLRIIKDNDTLQTYKIIVGSEKRRSPIITSKLRSVVFNPTWTVPPTIIKEDLVPDATKSRRYFSRMQITIYNYKNEKISPYAWNPEKANNYRYVQDPGNNNSLGNMKILFNNKYSVYLHDTNHKAGFSSSYRSLSSGCTRVQNPLKLAQYVLNDTVRFNDEKLKKLIETKETVTYLIKQDINHFQLYYTAWSKNNKLIFRDDPYNLDFDLYCRLRRHSNR